MTYAISFNIGFVAGAVIVFGIALYVISGLKKVYKKEIKDLKDYCFRRDK